MPRNVNTFTQFLPLPDAGNQNIILKNECYFSLIFLGGNYLSRGSILQRIFGGRDEVSLIAGLRLQPDGVLFTSVEEPNVVLDKRTIKPGKVTNIPLVLNLMVKIPANMDSIGFSFKIATTKRTDNFSGALDVLNDNKGVIEGFLPGVVGKALGVGKVVKDLFDKIDTANGRDLIQLVVNDFIIPATANNVAPNVLQEGYLVILVKNEEEGEDEQGQDAVASVSIDDGFGNEKEISEEDTIQLDVNALEQAQVSGDEQGQDAAPGVWQYDEVQKVLKVDGKVVVNTYLVFKIKKDIQRGENLNANWSRKYTAAVETLANEFDKTKARLAELMPKVKELMNEGNALLSEDTSFSPTEKKIIKEKYIAFVIKEQEKYK